MIQFFHLVKKIRNLIMTEPIDNTKIDTNLNNIESFTFDMPQGNFSLSVEIAEADGIRGIEIGRFDNYEEALKSHTEVLQKINVSGFFVVFLPGGSVTSYPKHKIHHVHITPIEVEENK